MPRTKKATPAVEGLAPSENAEIIRIQNESAMIVEKAKEIAVVSDAESESRAAEFLKQLKLRMDVAETARVRLVKPLNDHVKMINAEFKKTTNPLSEADVLVRQGMTAYRNSQAFKEAEAKRIEIEQQARVAARQGDMETLENLSSEHAAASMNAPRVVTTASGSARFRKVWKVEIVDLEALPAGYWVPDMRKIELTASAGIAIPGVKAWQEETPVIL